MGNSDKFGAFFMTMVTTLLVVALIAMGKLDVWTDEATLSNAYIIGVIMGTATVVVCYFMFRAWKNL